MNEQGIQELAVELKSTGRRALALGSDLLEAQAELNRARYIIHLQGNKLTQEQREEVGALADKHHPIA